MGEIVPPVMLPGPLLGVGAPPLSEVVTQHMIDVLSPLSADESPAIKDAVHLHVDDDIGGLE